ncbi:MAG: hypothetical protein AAF449_04410 [Myxococcota bacterium]
MARWVGQFFRRMLGRPTETVNPAPHTLVARVQALEAHQEQRMLRVAEEALRRGHPDQAVIAYQKAAARFRIMGQRLKEAVVLQHLIRLQPDSLEPLHQLIDVYDDLGRQQEGAHVRLRLAAELRRRGQGAEAEQLEQRAQALAYSAAEAAEKNPAAPEMPGEAISHPRNALNTEPSPIPATATEIDAPPSDIDSEDTGELPNPLPPMMDRPQGPGPLGPVARSKSRVMMPEIERARMTVRPGPIAPSTRLNGPVAPSRPPIAAPSRMNTAPPSFPVDLTPPPRSAAPSSNRRSEDRSPLSSDGRSPLSSDRREAVLRTAAFRPSVSDLHDFADDFDDTGDVVVDGNATIAMPSVSLPERTDMFDIEQTAALASSDVVADLELDGFDAHEPHAEATMAMKALDETMMSSENDLPWNRSSPPTREEATMSFGARRFDDEDTDAGPVPRLPRVPADTTVFEQLPASMSEDDSEEMEAIEPQGRTRAYNADELRKLKKLFDNRR